MTVNNGAGTAQGFTAPEYIKTLKNSQVALFYENCSFTLIESNAKSKKYELFLDQYQCRKINYIQVIHGENANGQ